MKFRGLAGLFNGRGGIYAGGQNLTSVSFLAELITNIFPSYALGSATPTFTRATTATVTDQDGVIRNVLSGEARFTGARRVYNYAANSENLSAAGGWSVTNATTNTGQTDPNGGTAATRVTATVGGGQVYRQPSVIGSGTSFQTSLWVRRVTGTGVVRLYAADSSTFADITASLTTSWKRFSPGATTFYAGPKVNCGNIYLATAGDAVEIAFPLSEDVTGQSNTNPSEYVSVGVLSAPYHGSNVDGVKCFATTNGNTVSSNVVTEATGTPISSSILLGYLAEGQRTNLCLQSNAFTTTWVALGTPAATQNVTGPDGVANSAWTLTDNDVVATEGIAQAITLTAATYTMSMFVRKTTGAQSSYPVMFVENGINRALCTIDTSNGVATVWTANTGNTIVTSSAVCTSFNTDYWRVSLTYLATALSWTHYFLPAATANATQSTGSYDVLVTGSAVIYGADVELATFPSSYIPTTTASVTRNADVLTYAFTGNALAASGYCYCEVSTVQQSGTFLNTVIVSFANNALQGPLVCISGNALTTISERDGTNVATKTGLTSLATAPRKRAGSWGTNEQVTGDGATVATAVFAGDMGSSGIGVGCCVTGTLHTFATIRNLRIGTNQPSSAQLQAMTS